MACVGHASLDHVFEIDAFPAEPTKTLAHRFSARAGGMSLHASIACARLGARARLLSRVGDDEAATFLRRRLIEEGVQADGMQRVPGATTSLAAVIVDAGGTRQIFIHRGNALERAHPLDVRQLEGAELVLADPRWPEGAAAALRWARDHDVPALLDADVAPLPVLDRLVPLARWVAFSEAGLAVWARGATRDGALSRSVALGPSLGLVTLGPQGARWAEAGSDAMGDVAAPAVDALDTTGAGDVFHGALDVGILKGWGFKTCMTFASAVAAMKCRALGGRAGIPTFDEATAFLKERGFDFK